MTGSSVVADNCPTENATATGDCTSCPKGPNRQHDCPTQSDCESCYETTCYNIGAQDETYWDPCPWKELCDYAGGNYPNAAPCFDVCPNASTSCDG